MAMAMTVSAETWSELEPADEERTPHVDGEIGEADGELEVTLRVTTGPWPTCESVLEALAAFCVRATASARDHAEATRKAARLDRLALAFAARIDDDRLAYILRNAQGGFGFAGRIAPSGAARAWRIFVWGDEGHGPVLAAGGYGVLRRRAVERQAARSGG